MNGAATTYEPLPTRLACQLDVAPPQNRWLIEMLWSACGVGLIGGSPKSMKTWLGLEMVTAVASATPCLGQFNVGQPGPALIFLAEDALSDVRQRLVCLCRSRGISLDNLPVHVITAPTLRLDVAHHIKRLDATIAKLSPRLLLLDPLVRLHCADENNASDIAAILGCLRTLQRTYDLAIVLVHHTRKARGGKQHGQTLRGSGDLHAFGDSNLYLTQERRGLVLTPEHRAAPAPKPLCIELASGSPHLVIVDAKQDNTPSLERRLLDVLRRTNQPVPRTRLRERLAVNNKRLGDTLVALEQLGRIRRTSCGWVAIVHKPQNGEEL